MHAALRNFLMRIAAAAAVLLLAATGALAQKAPSVTVQEILIKISLLSFNDANLTGNYSVFHAKLAKPFRDQYAPDKLATTFKGFRDQQIDLSLIAARPPVPAEEAKVDDRGVLAIKGYFDTQPSRVYYDLAFIMSDGDWKLIRINVDVRKP
jgi:hypothetical protein